MKHILWLRSARKGLEDVLTKNGLGYTEIIPGCEKCKSVNRKETLKPHTVPCKSFEKVGVDIVDFSNVSYLILLKHYTKWVEICEFVNKSDENLMVKLKLFFSRFCVPSIVVSYKVPFNSYIFRIFARDWDFNYAFISPHFSQSNVMVEKGVWVVKCIMRKER